MKERLNILISAHEFSPYLGSECSSGWNVITNLSHHHDITVLYAETNQFNTNNYKLNIEKYINEYGRIKNLHLISVSQPKSTKLIARFNKFVSHKKTSTGYSFLYFLALIFWEKKVYHISKNIIKEQNIDIVHHFNHLSFREPGYLWKLNKPFVWGPTSGVYLLPFPYLIKLPPVILFTNLLRNLINITQSKLSINLNRAIKKASLIFFVTKEDGRYFEKKTSYIKHLLDTGGYTKNEPLDLINPVNENNDINILWVGRLDHLKALEILLYAIGSSNYLKSNVSIKIIGDGPQIDLYKKIAQKLKLNNIHWMGLISKKEVLASMKESDFLVHTSIKEAASAVVLEALSEGLPVICHDAFGLSFAVTKSCGIKVGFKSPENSIDEFKKAILILSKDKLLRSKLSLGAKERSNELNWQSMAETISLGYIETFNKTN